MINSDFNLKSLTKEFSQYKKLEEDLLAGYEVFKNISKLLDYTTERGIDEKSSPMIKLWKESEQMLESFLTFLNLI